MIERDIIALFFARDERAFVESDGRRDTEIRKLNLREDGIAEAILSAGDLRDS